MIACAPIEDFFQNLGLLSTLRQKYAQDHLTLLTTPALSEYIKRADLADQILYADKMISTLLQLRQKKYDRVYLFNRSKRNNFFAQLAWRRQKKIDKAFDLFSSHKKPSPELLDKLADDHLIKALPDRCLKNYVLLVPDRPHAQAWTPARYTGLAIKLSQQGLCPILIGQENNDADCRHVAKICADVFYLKAPVSTAELLGLAKHSQGVIGQDHQALSLCALSGCLTVALAIGAKRLTGPHVRIIQAEDAGNISVGDVIKAFNLKEITK